MKKERTLQLTRAATYLLCVVFIWRYGSSLGGTEFSGGKLTVPMLDMHDVGAILFLLALLLVFFSKRISAVTGLIAAVLCFPLFFYFAAPGPFRWLFRGKYSVPLSANFAWDTWTVAGIAVVVAAAYLSIRALSLSQPAPDQKSL